MPSIRPIPLFWTQQQVLRIRPRRLGAALLTTGLVMGGGFGWGSPSATAAEPTSEPTATINQAPVPRDDEVTVKGFEGDFVDVLANDSDPDGDDLRLCRVTVVDDAPLFAQIVSGDTGVFLFSGRGPHRGRAEVEGPEADTQRLAIFPNENRAGTYSVRYGVCDRGDVRFATVQVRVVPVPVLRARTVPGRRGVVQFSNPSDKKYSVDYFTGREELENPGTRIGVRAHDRVRIRTSARNLGYFAFQPRGGAFVSGTVRGIQRSTAQLSSTPTPREARR